MLQRPQKSNTSIDKLAKNLINAKLMNNGSLDDSMTKGASPSAAGRSTHSRRKPNKLMSSMNEDFQDPTASLMKADATDSSLLSGLVGKQSPPSPQSAAAALQALLDRTGQANGLGGHNALYQAAFNSSPAKNASTGGIGSLLTSKELAKLNLDVRNFKLQDSANSPQMQLQYNLNSLLGGSNGTNLNQLLLQQAGIDSSLLSGLMNSLNTNEKLNLLAKGRQSNQSTPNKSSRPSMTNGGRIEDHDDETVSAAAMMAAAGHGLNIGMINKHNQQQQRNARRNGDLIKGNSMSPSPRGTSCSEETETLHSSSGSPLSSTHDAVANGAGGGHHSSSSSSASASGSDTGRQRRRQKESNSGAHGSKYNDEDGDLDDADEDSRSSPNGSHSPHSSSLTQNGDNDLTANQNGDCDNSMMDNADDDDRRHDENDDLDDLDEDDLDEDQYDTTTNSSMNNSQALASGGRQRNRKSLKGNDSASGHGRNRNNSASSPTRSSSSQAQSRSVSPSLYHRDSPSSSSAAAAAAFPNLAAVAAANGIDSATAMLAAQSLLQQQTPGLTFPSLAASGLALTPTVGGAASTSSSKDQATTRKRRNDREAMSERIKKIKPVPADKKDDAYWERRRKNNEAAKRSRDLRRQKEDEIAVRASFLEQENLKLKAQVTILKAELSKLHFMLYNR